MQPYLITFAIPFYQNELLLKKAVLSVINQTISDWRLIISLDNQLSDELLTFISALKDNRISLVSNVNKGICNNWNNCLSAVESSYVTLLHADDELASNYVQVMFDVINNNPDSALYYCGVKIINQCSEPVFSFADSIKKVIQPRGKTIKLSGDVGLSTLLKGCFIFCPSICYQTSIIKSYVFNERWQMVLDLDLYARMLFDGYTFIGSNTVAYYYRRHKNNQTAKLTEKLTRFDEEVSLYQEISQHAQIKQWKKTSKVAKNKNIIRLHVGYLIFKNICRLRISRVTQLMLFYKNHFFT